MNLIGIERWAIIKTLLAVICVISILMQPLFFSTMGLLGMEYSGANSSPAYIAYVTTAAGLSLITYVSVLATKGISRSEGLLLVILGALFFLHGLWVIFSPADTALFPEFLVLFLLLGLPGFLSASVALKLNLQIRIIKVAEPFFIIIALGVLVFSVIPSLLGVKTASLGGANYQAMSYYSVFSFGMLLTYSTHIPRVMRYKWVSSAAGRLLVSGLMLGCIIGCFLGGGRGAFVLLLVYLFINFLYFLSNKNNFLTQKGFIQTAVKLISFSILAFVFVVYFWKHDFVQSGFLRATKFISPDGGVDLERGSSGRDEVYKLAIDYIQQQPVIGYGPFGFMDETIHAHNIFLELWLQFGILGIIGFIILFSCLMINGLKNWSMQSYWAANLMIYPLVMLMFSGSYMLVSTFIYGVSFFTMYKRQGSALYE